MNIEPGCMRSLGGVVMRIHTVFSISLSMIVVGCAIRPLPRDVTRDTTVEIINKIRCEARRALVDELLRLFERSKFASTNALVPPLKSGMRKFKDLNDWEVDKRTLGFVNKFRYAGIGLQFTFTITENNNKTGNASFRMPFTGGTFTLGLKAGSEKASVNERIVNIVESFS